MRIGAFANRLKECLKTGRLEKRPRPLKRRVPLLMRLLVDIKGSGHLPNGLRHAVGFSLARVLFALAQTPNNVVAVVEDALIELLTTQGSLGGVPVALFPKFGVLREVNRILEMASEGYSDPNVCG